MPLQVHKKVSMTPEAAEAVRALAVTATAALGRRVSQSEAVRIAAEVFRSQLHNDEPIRSAADRLGVARRHPADAPAVI